MNEERVQHCPICLIGLMLYQTDINYNGTFIIEYHLPNGVIHFLHTCDVCGIQDYYKEKFTKDIYEQQ